MRLAYLCNLYPAVSHSFVRREIEAVERAGNEVHRFSLRPARTDLKDEADLREAKRTEAVLGSGVGGLLGSAVALSLSRPSKSAAALLAAWRLSAPGFKARLKHIAYWLEAAWLARRLHQLKIEHVHAHFGTNSAAVALLARAFGGPPFSFTVHGPDEFDAPLGLSLAAKVEAATAVAAISSYGRSQLMRWTAQEQWKKIALVRCGLASDFLEVETKEVPPTSTQFLCVARLSAQKGLPLLIAACDRLRASGAQFTLKIVGDGELRDELTTEVGRRRLDDRIELMGARTSFEIREYLLESRAFVLPSFAEGLPVVLMEALALSRPVITTAVAGIPELVDRECGWLIPAGSVDALTAAMAEALGSAPERLSQMGEVGRERVLRMHDANTNAARLLAAIGASSALRRGE